MTAAQTFTIGIFVIVALLGVIVILLRWWNSIDEAAQRHERDLLNSFPIEPIPPYAPPLPPERQRPAVVEPEERDRRRETRFTQNREEAAMANEVRYERARAAHALAKKEAEYGTARAAQLLGRGDDVPTAASMGKYDDAVTEVGVREL